MKSHTKVVAKSYDKAIAQGKKGVDAYKNLPAEILNNSNYPLYLKMRQESNFSDSSSLKIMQFLSPQSCHKFIDLGCCLNLMFSGYDSWQSIYYGIDISKKTIKLLKKHVKENSLNVGVLHCGSMHNTPFPNDFFDIGCCIGSLEYFEKDFVCQCVNEFMRILKPNGKIVIDIPNIGSAECEIACLIEKYLGREDKFNMSIAEFEDFLGIGFNLVKKEVAGAMIQYFLIKKA